MDKSELITAMINDGVDVVFTYNGQKAGLCSNVYNGVFSFQAWCGESIKVYRHMTLESVIEDPFFDGKSISDLLKTVDMRLI